MNPSCLIHIINKTQLKKKKSKGIITLGLMLSRVTGGAEGFEEGMGAIEEEEEDRKRDCETEERGPLC